MEKPILTDHNVIIGAHEGEDDKYEHRSSMYYPSFDVIRTICIALIVVIEFGQYLIPITSYIEPMLYFSHGTLFTIYGYLVLQDGKDLTKNIKHALKVFLIMLAIYGLITGGFYYLTTGNFFAAISKRGLFNFFVLNVWGSSIGSSIWFVQATLYSLIALWILRKFKEYDWLLCAICFAIAFCVGELAGLLNFSVLGYSFIPGNFLTRAIPYMLLGRLVWKYKNFLIQTLFSDPIIYFFGGLVICAVEFIILGFSGHLVYSNHYIGFTIMAASLCLRGVCIPNGGKFAKYAPTIYKGMYYTFNPLGYGLLLLATILCQTELQYAICVYALAAVVILLDGGFFWLVAIIKLKIQEKKEAKLLEEKENLEKQATFIKEK